MKNKFIRLAPIRLSVGLAILFSFGLSCFAASLRTWDGGAGNNFWTDPANWALDLVPASGDDLLFPSGAARLVNSNNFLAGKVFTSVTFSGGNYEVRGSLVALAGGVTNLAGVNSFRFPVTLQANQVYSASGGFLGVDGDTDTAGRTLTFAVGAGAEIQVRSPISGTGGITKIGSGLLTLGANDSYLGASEILEGMATLTHSNGLGAAVSGTTVGSGAIIALSGTGTFTVGEPLALAGRLMAATTGAGSEWSGPITVFSSTASVDVGMQLPFLISGPVSGTGSLTKIGPGTLRLTGNNSYTGITTNSLGTLIINGNQPSSDIVIAPGGTLGGTGRVGSITCLAPGGGYYPTVQPGEIGVGKLISSKVIMNSAYLNVRLETNTPAAGYGQLQVNGSVAITNCGLQVVLKPGFVPALGDSFVIIDNDGNDPVSREFRFHAEGTAFSVGSGVALQISYHGGTGNDVVLTRVVPDTGFAYIRKINNGWIQFMATGGVYGFNYSVIVATNLNPPVYWSKTGNGAPDINGQFLFTDATAPAWPTRFYRLSFP